MNMHEIISFTLVGIGLTYFGFMIWKKQIIGIIHHYHYTKLSPLNKKMYCKYMGIGSILAGVACIQYPYVKYLISNYLATVIFTIMVIVGILLMVYSQIKYNKGIF